MKCKSYDWGTNFLSCKKGDKMKAEDFVLKWWPNHKNPGSLFTASETGTLNFDQLEYLVNQSLR